MRHSASMIYILIHPLITTQFVSFLIFSSSHLMRYCLMGSILEDTDANSNYHDLIVMKYTITYIHIGQIYIYRRWKSCHSANFVVNLLWSIAPVPL